jgi:hypothetical protein
VNRQLGAKVCRKMFTFICLTICLRFARNRPLGKAQSHLQGVLRRDARTRPTCTLNVQQNSSVVRNQSLGRLSPGPSRDRICRNGVSPPHVVSLHQRQALHRNRPSGLALCNSWLQGLASLAHDRLRQISEMRWSFGAASERCFGPVWQALKLFKKPRPKYFAGTAGMSVQLQRPTAPRPAFCAQRQVVRQP